MLVAITRAYGGQEGKRIRVGERFWVAKPGSGKKPKGMREMTLQRFNQLKQQRLAVEATDAAAPAAAPPKPGRATPPRRPASPVPGAKVEPDSRPPGERREAHRRVPPPPPPINTRPGGSQTGEGGSSSSSQAAPQTGPSTLQLRGNRRGQRRAGSPSTTPTDSVPGPKSSTPATPNGGDTTTESGDGAAFD